MADPWQKFTPLPLPVSPPASRPRLGDVPNDPIPVAARGTPSSPTPPAHGGDPWGVAGTSATVPPALQYPTAAEFSGIMDTVYGKGAWTETGGWRSQERERQLHAQGALTVAPGQISPHSEGTMEQPGARDIVVRGMTPDQAAAVLARHGYSFAQLFPEGAHGNQGAHLHIGFHNAPVDPWAVASTAPAPGAPTAAPRSPQISGSVGGDGVAAGAGLGAALARQAHAPPAAPPPSLLARAVEQGNNVATRVAIQHALGKANPLLGLTVGAAGNLANTLAGVIHGGGESAAREGAEQLAQGGFVDPATGQWIEFQGTPQERAAMQAGGLGELASPTHPTEAFTGPVTNALRNVGDTLTPPNPNLAQKVIGMGVGFAPMIAAGAVPGVGPVLAYQVMKDQAYDETYREAKANNATDGQASQAAEAAGVISGGLASIPGGGSALEAAGAAALRRFAPKVAMRYAMAEAIQGSAPAPVSAFAGRVAAHAVAGGVQGGAIQIGENAVAQPSYDPTRSLFKGVPESAAGWGLMAGGLHAAMGARGVMDGEARAATRIGTNPAKLKTVPLPGDEVAPPVTTKPGKAPKPSTPMPQPTALDSMIAGIPPEALPEALRPPGGERDITDTTDWHRGEPREGLSYPPVGMKVGFRLTPFGELHVGVITDHVPERNNVGVTAEDGSNVEVPLEAVSKLPSEPDAWTPEREAAFQAQFSPEAPVAVPTKPETPEAAPLAPEAAPGLPPADEAPGPSRLNKAGGIRKRPGPMPMTPEIRAQINSHTQGVPEPLLTQAKADVKWWKNPGLGPNILTAIAKLGGMRNKTATGDPVAGPDIMAALEDANLQPGVINNKSGMSPENMREALFDNGWFGPRPEDAEANFLPLIERQVRGDKIHHPDVADDLARHQELDGEIFDAGVSAADHHELAAAKLAADRHLRTPASDELRAWADALGVPHDPQTTHRDLEHDVLEREAVKALEPDHLDQIEHQHDESLTPDDHARLDAEVGDLYRRGSYPQQTPAPDHRAAPDGHDFAPLEAPGMGGEAEGAAGSGGGEGEAARPEPKPGEVTPEARAKFQALIQETRARRGQADELGAKGGSLRMAHPDGRKALVGPDLVKPGVWRSTHIGKDGVPFGHQEYPSMADAIFDELQSGYRPTEPTEPTEAPKLPGDEHAPPKTETMNLGGDKVEQGVMPGMEPSAQQAAGARGPTMKPKRPQADAGPLFAPPPLPEQDIFAPPTTPEPKPPVAEPPGEHLYRPLLRPPHSSSLPAGLKWDYAELPPGSPINRPELPTSKFPHGVIKADRALTPEELHHFDLKPVEPAPAEAKPPLPSDWGAKNTIVTKDEMEVIRARMRAKRNQLNSLGDPEEMLDGMKMAVYHIEAGARKFADFVRVMTDDLGDWVRPYLGSWYDAARRWPGNEAASAEMSSHDEVTHVLSQQQDLERDSPAGAPADQNGEGPVSAGPGEPERGPGGAGEQAGGGGRPERGSGGVPDGGAPPVGEPGDHGLRGEPPVAPGDAPQPGERGGGGSPSHFGVQPDRVPASDLVGAAASAAHVEPVPANAGAPTDVSVDAPPVPPDIERDLPTLLPAQRADVAFAERRFAKPDGHGVLFTNGTGTGKTFVGGGIIKRFYNAGKRNILVLAPTQGILNQWKKELGKLGVPAAALDSASTHGGSGVVLTTYANLGGNFHLGGRRWDLVVGDEADNLMSDAAGTKTRALKNIQAITIHPDGASTWADMHFPDEARRVAELQSQYDKLRGGFRKDAAYRAYSVARQTLSEKAQPYLAKFAEEPRPKSVFLSASPFAYDKDIDWAQGYLFDYPPDPQHPGYNDPKTGKDAFFIEHFGYRMRTGRLTRPDNAVDNELMERSFHEWMRARQVLSGREQDLAQDYDRQFQIIESGIGRKIDQALDFLRNGEGGRYRDLAGLFDRRFPYLKRQRLLEALKAEAAIPIIQQHLALGRKLVLFHQYNEGGGFSPFEWDQEMEAMAQQEENAIKGGGKPTSAAPLRQLYEEFIARNPYVNEMNEAWHKLGSPIDTITKAFPHALVYNGTISAKNREAAKDLFNTDGSGRDVMIVQADAGSHGLSLHDVTGKHQRVVMVFGMFGRPTKNLQIEGRTYRIGVKTNAVYRYLTTDTSWERFAFRNAIAERSGTVENLAMGNRARSLRDAFIHAYENADVLHPHPDEGTGGKAGDFNRNAPTSDFQRAISYYFGQQRNTRTRNARQGVDYFATPEPVGQKMVEWAGLRPGEHALEPSAGHGAIARWFPETNSVTAIEPSSDLASRTALAAPNATVREMRFEDLHRNQKYDAIVMNPPFGTGGSTAIEHLGLAVTHLRNGGRIVALIPEGPAADAKFEKFMASDEAKHVYKVADVSLPEVTFERAGTKARTRIVILDRHTDPDLPPRLGMTRIDLTHHTTVRSLFDSIEHQDVVPRIEPRTKDAAPAPEGAAPGSEATPADFTTSEHENNGGLLHVASGVARTSRDEWGRRNDIAKQYSGRYYGKDAFTADLGRPPGWYFDSAEARDAFLTHARTGEATHIEGVSPPEPGKATLGKAEATNVKRGGIKVHVATMENRVDRGEYDRLASLAAKHGGKWSSWRGRGAVPGFQFNTPETRDAFIAEANSKAAPDTPADVLGAQRVLRDLGSGRQLNSGVPPEAFGAISTVAREGITKALAIPDRLASAVAHATAKLLPADGYPAKLLHATRAAISPMVVGAREYQAAAKTWANSMRAVMWEGAFLDRWIGKEFTREAQERMWNAADEHSVIEQRGKTVGDKEGLNRLDPREQALVATLQQESQKLFKIAKALEMTKAAGLPSYVPRMVIALTESGQAKRLSSKKPSANPRSTDVGMNLTTSSPNLLPRLHLTREDTEAAAQLHDPDAVVVTNIRTLNLANTRLRRAIAGRLLMNAMKGTADSVGAKFIHEVDPDSTDAATNKPTEGTFTIPGHPAFTRVVARFHQVDGKTVPLKDELGNVLTRRVQLYLPEEARGPMNAVLSSPSHLLYNAAMAVKSLQTKLIMYSPLTHLQVVAMKAVPVAGVKVPLLMMRGAAARSDPDAMHEALMDGLSPTGRNFQMQDITGLAQDTLVEPGQSITSRLIGRIPSLFNKDAGQATMRIADTIGNASHDWLWEQVANLQMGIYTHLRDKVIKEGVSPKDAGIYAAHEANRVAGVIPQEAMGKVARMLTNLLLFARGFTLTNIGAVKDLIAGLPRELQAQILRNSGAKALARVQGMTRRRAAGMIAVDVGVLYAISTLGAMGVAAVTGQPVKWPWSPGREKDTDTRINFGHNPDGTELYARPIAGKWAEEMVNWRRDPGRTLVSKLSPLAGAAWAVATNDRGFGQHVTEKDDSLVTAAGKIAWEFIRRSGPEGMLESAGNLITNHGDQTVNALGVIGPTLGFTVSHGYPGGEEAAAVHEERERYSGQREEGRHAVKDDVKTGDPAKIAAARQRLINEFHLNAADAAWEINHIQHPTISKGANLSFGQNATPEERSRRAAAAAIVRRQAGVPAI